MCVCYVFVPSWSSSWDNWSSILFASTGLQRKGLAALPSPVWEQSSQQNRMSSYETSSECLVCFQQKCSYELSIFEVFLKITWYDFNNLHQLYFSTWAEGFVYFLLGHWSPIHLGVFWNVLSTWSEYLPDIYVFSKDNFLVTICRYLEI